MVSGSREAVTKIQACLLVMVVVVAAGGSYYFYAQSIQPSGPTTLTIAAGTEAASLDPHATPGGVAADIYREIHDNLF